MMRGASSVSSALCMDIAPPLSAKPLEVLDQ